ncbi:MAG: hypothetical protein KDK36_04595, partial [Leptospiraceae bacterium]|nr:hypothetical protein [Leptospiraceae bacterium]
DKSLKSFLANFFSDKIEQYQKVLSPAYSGEVYYLLARFYKDLDETSALKDSIDKARYFYNQVKENDYLYSAGNISNKLEILKKLEQD